MTTVQSPPCCDYPPPKQAPYKPTRRSYPPAQRDMPRVAHETSWICPTSGVVPVLPPRRAVYRRRRRRGHPAGAGRAFVPARRMRTRRWRGWLLLGCWAYHLRYHHRGRERTAYCLASVCVFHPLFQSCPCSVGGIHLLPVWARRMGGRPGLSPGGGIPLHEGSARRDGSRCVLLWPLPGWMWGLGGVGGRLSSL